MSGAERQPLIGAILVGGGSTRLGRDKARVEVGGIPLVARIRGALAQVVPEIVLVGKAGGANPLPDLQFVTDDHPVRCALAGVVRALEAAAGRRTVVVACDHPFLSPVLLTALLGRPGDADARVPLVAGSPAPLVAVYEASAALPILSRRLEEGRFGLIRSLDELRLDLVPEEDLREADPHLLSFLNVNTPEDLERAQTLAVGG